MSMSRRSFLVQSSALALVAQAPTAVLESPPVMTAGTNSLMSLMPSLYAGLNAVSRELCGLPVERST